jgi:hypothetical protein
MLILDNAGIRQGSRNNVPEKIRETIEDNGYRSGDGRLLAGGEPMKLHYAVSLAAVAMLCHGHQAQASQVIPWSDIETAYDACTNVGLDHLHPYSLKMLSALSQGTLLRDDPQNEFLRAFTMPNSEYEPVGACILGFLRSTRAA